MNRLNKHHYNLIILNQKKDKIDNIFILIEVLPFLKKKIIIDKKKNTGIYQFCKNLFKIKKNYNIITIDKHYYSFFIKHFKEIIYYIWESIPTINIINNLRFIINNFYNENCLVLFEKALNLNLEKFILNNKNKFSFKNISYLMSKYNFINC